MPIPNTSSFKVRIPLSNREPWDKRYREAVATVLVWEDSDKLKLDATDLPDDAFSAVFLLDDGKTVEPRYVGGYWIDNDNESDDVRAYHSFKREVILSRFPVNVNADGTPILRADDKRPVDFSTWAIGPRTCYHLKTI